jgi:hypothetical protein
MGTCRKATASFAAFLLLAAQPAGVGGQTVAALRGAAPSGGAVAGAAILTESPNFLSGPALSGIKPGSLAMPSARAAQAEAGVPSGLLLVPARKGARALKAVKSSEQPSAPGVGLRARTEIALKEGRTAAAFDGSSLGHAFIPGAEPSEVAGVSLDEKPVPPSGKGSFEFSRVHLPGRGGLIGRIKGFFGRLSHGPVELAGDPKTPGQIEAALRRLVSERSAEFGGISPDSLYTVFAKRVSGQGRLDDAVYVSFRQSVKGLGVDGTNLNFTVKLLGGKAVVVASSGRLFPKVEVDPFGKLGETEILASIARRLGSMAQGGSEILELGSKVMHLGGRWRAVDLRMPRGKGLVVAVDLNTGESFAWDPRVRLVESPAAVEGEVRGRGMADGPIREGKQPDLLPLAHVAVKTSDGKTIYADKDGRFTVPGSGDGPVTLTVRLDGKFASVTNSYGSGGWYYASPKENLVVTVVAKPGEVLRAVFNPSGATENATAQVTAYYHVTHEHEWLKQYGVEFASLNKMLVNVNIDDECNAYFSPYDPSLNFYKSSPNCANTAFNDVIYHEYGHAVDEAAGGITNHALSEGWGDIMTLFITGQPMTGRGFIKSGNPPYIRHGDNKYQYRRYDEVHVQGQAWMGFAWKLRKALIASIGEAEGAALASMLIIPVILTRPRDIPAAIEGVVMRALGADGKVRFFDEIFASAKAHGITIKEPGSGQKIVNIDLDESEERRPWDPWELDWGVAKAVKGLFGRR